MELLAIRQSNMCSMPQFMTTMDENHFARSSKCAMHWIVYCCHSKWMLENAITHVNTDEEMEILLQQSSVLFFCVYVRCCVRPLISSVGSLCRRHVSVQPLPECFPKPSSLYCNSIHSSFSLLTSRILVQPRKHSPFSPPSKPRTLFVWKGKKILNTIN